MLFEWLNDASPFLALTLPYFFIFLSGLFIGSFLNVVADRTSRNEDFVKGHSHCDSCNTMLKAIDLVPVLSFISTFGKCRYCKQKLSIAYPLSEVFTGALFVLALNLSGYTTAFSREAFGQLVYLLVVFSFYITIFLADFKYQLIPNKIVIPAIIFVAFATFIGTPASFWSVNVLTAILLMGFFWFLYAITKGKGMGFGDVRLALLIGLLHPFPQNVLAIFGSFVLGATFSIFWMLLGKANMKTKIAFGPFMIASSVATMFLGRTLVTWYFSHWLGI
jgi:prepilin signal peptidase PulO-like enzyme (type II secretory pathway)